MIRGSKKLAGFDSPTVWSVMTPLAIKTNSVNLGQGFPSWAPPQFYRNFLKEAVVTSNHQYSRAFGSLSYTQAIAYHHRESHPDLNHETDIVTVNGGVEGLFCSFMAFLDEGDEAIIFDPSYDCYRPQIQMAGGVCKALELKPKHSQTKAQILARSKLEGGFKSAEPDDWGFDIKQFQQMITPKTKVVLINSPHNPCGKVFTHEELKQIEAVLVKHPQVVVVEDNVYDGPLGMTFDEMCGKQLPKLSSFESMRKRCVSIYSAGKIFAATGVRSGWVVGDAQLIRSVRSVHQYNVFCAYQPIENTIAKSLTEMDSPQNTYLLDCSRKLEAHRNLLLKQLIESKFDFDIWVPKGGYFVYADISRVQVPAKYMVDQHGQPRTKDYGFCISMANQERVVAIPCSNFYDKTNKNGERYVRFAFCKDEEMILEAGKRMK